MSLFPDCRHDDYYNEDFLDSASKAFLNGMDTAFEQIKNLFDNLDAFEDELTETAPEDTPAGDEVFASSPELYGMLQQNTTLLQVLVENWYETERNETITSMIDDMDEDEYQKLREKAMSDNPDKEYYDTRKFMCTGKKEKSE